MNILKAFGLLVLGVIIGMICQCSKDKSMFNSQPKEVIVHDTINVVKFGESPADTVYINKEKIVYKSIIEHDTQTFTIVKKEIEFRDKWNTQLVEDKTCKDSLRTTTILVDTLLNQIAELQKLKVFRDTLIKKDYSIKLSVLGQNVKQTSMEVIINKSHKSNFSVNPKAGLNFNDGQMNNASIGLGFGYKNLTIDGLYTPQTNQIGIYLGYNLTF